MGKRPHQPVLVVEGLRRGGEPGGGGQFPPWLLPILKFLGSAEALHGRASCLPQPRPREHVLPSKAVRQTQPLSPREGKEQVGGSLLCSVISYSELPASLILWVGTQPSCLYNVPGGSPWTSWSSCVPMRAQTEPISGLDPVTCHVKQAPVL